MKFVFNRQEDEENVMELDPSQFLAQGSSDDDSENEHDMEHNGSESQNGDGPPILTSLGLTHINSVSNPFASYAVSACLPLLNHYIQPPLSFITKSTVSLIVFLEF